MTFFLPAGAPAPMTSGSMHGLALAAWPGAAFVLTVTGGLSTTALLSLAAVFLIAALTGTAWWYARVNQSSIAALHTLAQHLRNQSQLIGEELVVMRQQLDLMRHQWEDERRGRLEFWLTAVDDEDLRMPFKPPFGSKRTTFVSGWILEAWNPSTHVVRLLDCTIRDPETGLEEQAGSIRLIRAEAAWVLPLTEIVMRLLGRINDARDHGNWKKLLEQPVALHIALRYQGNDGEEQTLGKIYDVQLGGGWERFDLLLSETGKTTGQAAVAVTGKGIGNHV